MSLWNLVYSVHLCFSVRNRTHLRVVGSLFFYAGYFFLSQRTQRSRRFWRTVSSPQNASGIQRSQSVSAKEGCWVMVVRCWWLATWASRRLLPSPFGEGLGGEALSYRGISVITPLPFGRRDGEGATCCWGGTSIFSGLVYFKAKYLTSHFLPYFKGVMNVCKG